MELARHRPPSESRGLQRGRFTLSLAMIAMCSLSASSRAQLPQQRFQSEVRLDAIQARNGAVDLGYGVSVPTGLYVRTGLVGGLGVGAHGADGRLDLVLRFSLDPFRQSHWAPYGGAGLSGRFRSERDGGYRAFLLVYLGLEGPLPMGARSGFVPAFELGLGGGVRLGLILRRGINARR